MLLLLFCNQFITIYIIYISRRIFNKRTYYYYSVNQINDLYILLKYNTINANIITALIFKKCN